MEVAAMPASTTSRFFPVRDTDQEATQYRPRVSSVSSIPLFDRQHVLFGEISPGWAVARLLMVTLEQDEYSDYLASDDVFGVYGEGRTAAEALRDYVVALVDYYQLLSGRADDAPTRALFHRLQSYLVCV